MFSYHTLILSSCSSCSLLNYPLIISGKSQDICNRIGLDIIEHVLPYVLEEEESGDDNNNDESESSSGKKDDTITKAYTHEDYILGAEECLNIEAEMIELEDTDPEYLDQLERETLAEDPEIVAEIISDVLKQDESS